MEKTAQLCGKSQDIRTEGVSVGQGASKGRFFLIRTAKTGEEAKGVKILEMSLLLLSASL